MPEKIKRIEEPIMVENAKIVYRNLAGQKKRYNASGSRGFDVVIEDEHYAQLLIKDGWNLKPFKPRPDDEDEAFRGYHLPVKVKFDSSQPPKIIMITNKKAVILTEETVSLLDSADILKCDMVIRPYNWSLDDGSHGVKAYLKTLYATIQLDPFAEKYSDIQFANGESIDEETPTQDLD